MYVLKALLDALGKDGLYLSLHPEKLEFKTCVVETALLVPHEDVVRSRVDLITRDMEASGRAKCPSLVDARSFVVLDDHHGLKALKEIDIHLAPAFFVDRARDYVDAYPPFRKEMCVDRVSVLRKALEERNVFPPKTTKHVLTGASVLPNLAELEELENPARSRRPAVVPGTHCCD